MKSKNIILLLPLLFFFSNLFSQEYKPILSDTKSEFWDNVSYGGNLGLSFSNNTTSIIVAPSAIYNFNEKYALGTSLNFGYSNFRDSDVRQYNYGASAIGLFNLSKNIQLSAELEQTFVNQTAEIGNTKIRNNFNYPSLFVGGGYRVGSFAIGLRYDLLFDEDRSIFSSAFAPFVRFYI